MTFAARSLCSVATGALLVLLTARTLRAQEPVSTAPALVQPPDGSSSSQRTEEAAQRYDRGLKMYEEGDYSLAVIEFERAYELVPDYRVLYNIGQVRLQLAQYARARRALEEYLSAGGDQLDPNRKALVRADLEMLSARTGTLRISVNEPKAEVFVDDMLVGQSPLSEPLLLDAGEHRLSVRKPGFHARVAQLTLAGRDALSLEIELDEVPTPGERIIVQTQARKSDRNAWKWGTWTTAGVFAIASGVTGGLGIKAAGDLDGMRSDRDATRAELDSASRRARTLLLTADIFGSLAIATAGVALYITLSGEDSHEGAPPVRAPIANRLGLTLRPGGISLQGTY